MRAVHAPAFGTPEVLECRDDVAVPRPGAGEVLVRVRAAGVNPIDWIALESGDFGFGRLELPWIPGWDLAGVVEASGPGVTAFTTGDPVYGMPRMPEPARTYAEYTVVPAADLAAAPATLDLTAAAGVPMAALTAWQGLFTHGGLTAGERVLVHAAAGGVGHMAVQLAAWAGAYVVGTASAANADYVRSLGAGRVVDYCGQRFEEAIEPVDLVLDTVGGRTQRRSFAALADKGRLVALLDEPPDAPVTPDGRTRMDIDTRWFSVEPDATALLRVSELIDVGRLRPTISGVRPLSQARAALEESRDGHVRGKLVLDTAI